MNKIIKTTLMIIVLISLGAAQHKSALPQQDFSLKNSAQSDNSIMSLFDPSRFTMNHSFSMSMMSVGKQSIGIASYTNNMNFALRNNLRLQTFVTLMQPNMLSAQSPSPYANSQVYYNATLNYQPFENTNFQVSLGNYPRYNNQLASPFIYNRGY